MFFLCFVFVFFMILWPHLTPLSPVCLKFISQLSVWSFFPFLYLELVCDINGD